LFLERITTVIRNKKLDFLRGIAVTGVILQHSILKNAFTQSGWIGVDLFFVLSGFLVSGLLFAEIKKYNDVSPGRFLIRRGFKIYPAFYFFLLTMFIFKNVYKEEIPTEKVLSEIFFLQSYIRSFWLHSWSLAIEEHFYLFIAALIWWWTKSGFILKTKKALTVLIVIWFAVVCMRFAYCIAHIDEESIHFFATHLRCDGLLLGCILSFCFTFIDGTRDFFYRKRFFLIPLALLLLTPIYFWKAGDFLMDTYGITSFHFAFALIIAYASLDLKYKLPAIPAGFLNGFCYVGLYSYSIYLWHAFVMEICDRQFQDWRMHTLIYIPASYILGIFFSWLIEWPFLRLRERFFPGRKDAFSGLAG